MPCCQAEVAAAAQGAKRAESSSLEPLFEHPWHRREFGSHLTNVIRALTLEAYGYQVTVTELTGWEHSLKNELILGRRVHRENRPARASWRRCWRETGVQPKLTRVLGIAPARRASARGEVEPVAPAPGELFLPGPPGLGARARAGVPGAGVGTQSGAAEGR